MTTTIADEIEARRLIKTQTPKVLLNSRHLHGSTLLPNREQMLELLPQNAIVAEVGVAFGDFTDEIIKRTNPQRIHLVDLWGSERYKEGLTKIKQRFDHLIQKGEVIINQGISIKVLPTFPDKYFDWLYIDTDHSFKTTYHELLLSEGKVKDGGLILGHDYCTGNVITPVPYGVIEAVNKFCVDRDWGYLYLTVESHGHMSFCLRKIC